MSWRTLHPNVTALGFVSFFADVAADMVTPLLPFLLTAVLAAGPAALGLMEGVADAVASFFKLWAGRRSDSGARKPWVVAGYALSTFTRPAYALAGAWGWVIAIRSLDRVGKGLRTSPRDALIGDVTPPAQLGLAFGFHRALDNAGAVIGGLCAAAALYWFPNNVKEVILVSLLPGLAALAVLVWGVKETPRASMPGASMPNVSATSTSPKSDAPKNATQQDDAQKNAALKNDEPPENAHEKGVSAKTPMDWAFPSEPGFRRYLGVVGLFTFARLPETFIILLGLQQGQPIYVMLLVWAAYSAVKALASYWGGGWADAWGLPTLLLAGWIATAAVYYGFCWATGFGLWAMFAAALAYGAVVSMYEGAEPALVAKLCAPQSRGAAFGWYHLVKGLAAIPAGLAVGLIWEKQSAAMAFSYLGAVAALGALLFLLFVRRHLQR